jgi:hypothetical protein
LFQFEKIDSTIKNGLKSSVLKVKAKLLRLSGGKSMSSQTTTVSRQCRLQEWAEMVHACKSRPIGMTVDEWCDANSMSKLLLSHDRGPKSLYENNANGRSQTGHCSNFTGSYGM